MFNLNNFEIGSLISNVLILGLLISSFFIRGQNINRNKKIKQISAWLLGIFLLATLYNNRYIFHNFIPFRATETSENGLQIQRSNDGHFYIMAQINQKNILFLIDTGATSTTLTLEDAKRIGINLKKLTFNQPISTANGITYAASIFIKNFKINNIKFNSIYALVGKDLGEKSLLGMNFLNSLKRYEINNDKMILYY